MIATNLYGKTRSNGDLIIPAFILAEIVVGPGEIIGLAHIRMNEAEGVYTESETNNIDFSQIDTENLPEAMPDDLCELFDELGISPETVRTVLEGDDDQ